MTSLGAMWHAARNPPRDPTDLSFKDKTVLVTGANSGLGHEAAIKYARQGANPLILAVRTPEKGEQAKADIIRATGVSPDIFIIETVDLSTFTSVEAFANRVNERVHKLHVLQLVAGISMPSFKKSPENYEMGLQVCVLSTALMALLLLPKVIETAKSEPDAEYAPHITFVNSVASQEIDPKILPDPDSGETLIQRLNDEKLFDNVKEYYIVKLANMFVVRALAERVGSAKVIVNATCPGMCKTNMGRDFPLAARLFMEVFYVFFGRSAEQGARSLISATGLGPESQGRFWTNDQLLEQGKFLASEQGNELYHQTWNEILSILRKHVPSDAIE